MMRALLLILALLAQAPATSTGASSAASGASSPQSATPSASAPTLNAGLPPASVALDRSNPRATLQGLLDAIHDDDPVLASHELDLGYLPKNEQGIAGPKLARRLAFLIERKLKTDVDAVTSNPGGVGEGRPVVIGRMLLDGEHVPISLDRVADAGGSVWLFSSDTLRNVDALYAAYEPPFGEKMPEFLLRRPLGTLALWQWIGMLLVLVLAAGLAIAFERVLLAVFARMARLTAVAWDDELVVAAKGPLRLMMGAGLLAVGSFVLALPLFVQHGFDLLVRSLAIVSLAWFALRCLDVGARLVQANASGAAPDDSRARAIQTQIVLIRRIARVTVYVIAAALFLMQFELVRNVGVSLLASAGVAGLVIGLAAQKSISTLLAGIQLSLTQPIRIGDFVVLESESGNVEEISFTFVVVRLWDGRRMVVPITYFLEKPFQNWNKGDPKQLGPVSLEVDFRADVEVFRKALVEVLNGAGKEMWDGQTQGIVITDAKERTMTIRALVGAKSFGVAWDLRCIVREHLIGVLQKHPEWMPQVRTQSPSAAAGTR